MQTEKELTGYPSIDKPWMKYYKEGASETIESNDTLYNNFKKVVLNKPDDLALIDFKSSKKYTYKQLLSQIDLFARGLANVGIRKYNKIGMLGFNSLFDPIVLLAGNKLGATVIFVDPDGGIPEIEKNIRSLDILVLENIFAEIEPIINNKSIPTVICGSTQIQLRANCQYYNIFIKSSSTITDTCEYEKDHPALVVFSSGSTGAPKPIVHSDYTVNKAINKVLCSDFPINENNYLIKAIPSHIGLGVITTMCTALLNGVTYIQLKGMPDPSIGLMNETLEILSDFKGWIMHNNLEDKGVILFAAPFFAKFLASKIDVINDLSMVHGILLGGAKMEKEDLEQMESIFAAKGLAVPICNGYGQNEMAGAVALNTVLHNKNGSAGYPVFNTSICIVDRNTLEEMPYNRVGQILEKSDSQFLYYLDMPEKTEKTKVILPNNTVWYDSTDLGYMDEDGFLYITGRTTRVFIKTDHKVSMDVIEDKIRTVEFVRDVAVVPFSGEEVIAFVCLNEPKNNEEVTSAIKSESVGLSVFEIPCKIEILEELPRMNNGKIDYVKLENMAK